MKTADLEDSHGDEVRFCDLPFIKLGRRKTFYGPIATVKCFEDNALLKTELQKPGNGRVMIVDGGGSTRRALVGDQIGLILRDNGWAGIVVRGAVRDTDELDALDIGVFCLATSPKKSSKDGAGQTDIAVEFGGVTFRPGEFAYADRDGLVVSRKDYP